MGKGYIYRVELKGPDDLEALIGPESVMIAEEVQRYEFLPAGGPLPSKGRCFSERGEVRLSSCGDGRWDGWLLCEEERDGLERAGVFDIEEQELLLQNLEDRSINPSFKKYPGGSRAGTLSALLYKRGGMPVTYRLRGLR